MLPTTFDRVPMHTAPQVNDRIMERTAASLARHAHGEFDEMQAQLDRLDGEWDTERALEATAATMTLVGVGLGLFVNRRFLAMPAVIAGFLLQHALQGWCPPLPVFRRLGVRTAREIDRERYALKALRGDFRDLTKNDGDDVRHALAAAH